MAGTLVVDTLKSSTTNPPVFQNTSGIEAGQLCRAWVNFNGVTSATVRASFNVSSVTRNAVGDYTVNFTSAMPDANYSVVGTTLSESASNQPGGVSVAATNKASGPILQSASQIQVRTGFGNTAVGVDFASIYISIFR